MLLYFGIVGSYKIRAHDDPSPPPAGKACKCTLTKIVNVNLSVNFTSKCVIYLPVGQNNTDMSPIIN